MKNIYDNDCAKQTLYPGYDSVFANEYFNDLAHSCMPSPLAPDPIRVQSYVCFLLNQ